MSISAPPRRSEPEEATTQAASVHSNRNQMWYQKLCREEYQRALLDDPNESFPSPQRLQLQLHFQREYQQRQELQKNCRQEWWQRKSGLGSASPSPYNYRTPSPGRKFYAGAPVYYQDVQQTQPATTTTTLPRTVAPQPPARSYYQPADVESVSAECRRRIDCDLIDREREKMIKAAQVIKHDAEKRIRQAKRDMAVPPSDQGNIQRLLLQLLKEQDLAQKLKASSQVPPAPTPMSNLSVDLQYKLATLLQAYQPLQAQQVSANYQRKWQEQIGTYKDMLQEYRQGNFFQSHQKAKRLLQLLLQREPPSAQMRLPPRFYPPDQQAVYQQYNPNHDGGAPQPYFRAPLPPLPNRTRRDPRLNRSSQQFYNRGSDITPRLNQSSYQYSEQDVTPEIIYQADVSRKPGIVRRNSTPRKQCEEQAVQEVTVVTSAEGGKMQQHVTYADDHDRDFQKPMETQTDSDTTLNRTSIASDEHDESDSRSESREYLQDWEQLQQRSRCHRRGPRYRHSSEERMGNGQRQHVNVAGKVEKTNAMISGSKEERQLYANQTRHEGDIRIVVNGDHRKAYPVKDALPEHLQSQKRARVCTGTQAKAPENFNQQTSDHHAEVTEKEFHQRNTQSKNYSLPNGDLGDKTEKVSSVTEKTPEINGTSEVEENHWMPEGPGDSQTRSKARVQFSSVQNDGSELETMTEQDDDTKSAEGPKDHETGRQGKDDATVLKQNNKDTKGVTGQSSEPQQVRPKQQPPAQVRQNGQSRSQASRQPQQNHRGSRQQPPPPRSARQSPTSSQQSSGSQHHVASTRPPSQQKLSESRSVQTETRTSSKGMKSSGHVPSENAAEKLEGIKSPGSSVSKQGGKKSPGNTYVIRNSGQKLSSKAAPGSQREKAGSTKSSTNMSSPGSSESKSPSDLPSKAQESPPERSRRRRYRRKPWDREEAAPYKTPRSNSAPRSQNRFQDQGRDVGQPGRWLSPSQRWMGRNANWESQQTRRRRYQWEDTKTAPARKWKAFGQDGKALPSKISSSEKDLRMSENEHLTTAPSRQVKPVPETVDSSTSCDLENNSEDMDEYSFTTQHEMSSDKELVLFEENSRNEDEDGEEKRRPEEAGNDTTEIHYEKKSQKIVPKLSKSSETGKRAEPTLSAQNNEEGEHQNYAKEMQTTIGAERRKTLQQERALQDSTSSSEAGLHTSADTSQTKTDRASGRGASESSITETASDSYIAAREAERSPSELQSLQMAQPETSLEHVLAVLGKKAAQNADESDHEDEDVEQQQQQQQVVVPSEAANDAVNKVTTEPELLTRNVRGAALENVTAPGTREGTCVSTADGTSQTESVQPVPAKIIRLEEMEDWQSLDNPNQEKCNVESKGALFNQNQDKTEKPDSMLCAGDGSSAEKEDGVTTANQAGATQHLEEVGEVSENRCQRDQKVTAVELSVQTEKTEDQPGSCNGVFESTAVENGAQNLSVPDSSCQSVVKEIQKPSAGLEQQTPAHSPENGKVPESSDQSLLKSTEKRDGQAPKDAPETDGPESGQVEKGDDRPESAKDVPSVQSEPETAGDKSCLISKGESQDQETFDVKGSESATDSEKGSTPVLQPEQSHSQDHSSSVTAHAKGCEEVRTGDTDKHQHSGTEESQTSSIQDDSQKTDLGGTAPRNKPASEDSSDKEPKGARELQSQPDLPSSEESSQSTAVLSDVDLCIQEETAVISPLSALTLSAVSKSSDAEELPVAVSQTVCIQSDSIDQSKMTHNGNLAVSSAEGNLEFDSSDSKTGNTTNVPNGNANDTPNDNTDIPNENTKVAPNENASHTPNKNTSRAPNENAKDETDENTDTPNGITDNPNRNTSASPNDDTSDVNANSDSQAVTKLDVQELSEPKLKEDGPVTDCTSRNADDSTADLSESSAGDKGTEADEKDRTPDDVKKKSSPETGNGFCREDHNETDRTQTMAGLCSTCGRSRASENGKKSRLNFGEILHDKLTAFGYL